jgi:hypothetical protein
MKRSCHMFRCLYPFNSIIHSNLLAASAVSARQLSLGALGRTVLSKIQVLIKDSSEAILCNKCHCERSEAICHLTTIVVRVTKRPARSGGDCFETFRVSRNDCYWRATQGVNDTTRIIIASETKRSPR